jgi:hypothetical protein
MKVMLNSLVLLLLLAAIAGCGTELNNYYGSVKKPESELLANYKAVRFDVFALDILPQNPAQETITSLSAEGQAEAVKVLGAKYGKTEDFLSSLAKPLEVISKPTLTVRSKFKRRIVIQVVDMPLLPADRIDQAIIRLSLKGAHFLSWDKFTTNHETIDLGTVTSKREFTGTASVKVTDPAAKIGEAEGQLQYTRSLEEGKSISRRFAAATAVLSPNEATIVMTGNENTRLTDNITVDAEIEIDHFQGVEFGFFEIGSLFLKNKPISPNKASLTPRRTEQLAPLQNLPIKINATMDYITRHVTCGGDTSIEGDDDIELTPGKVESIERDLVSKEEGNPGTYGLSLGADGLVHVKVQDGRLLPLKFKDYNQVLELNAWLQEVYGKVYPREPVNVGGQSLFIGQSEEKLLGGDVKRISVK